MSYDFFTSKELMCKCGCGEEKMNPSFMTKIVAGRRESSFRWSVTSAYRCKQHNRAVSNTGDYGPHTLGRALDIQVKTSQQRWFLVDLFRRLGMTRIGIGKDFVHVDDMTAEDGTAEEVMWTYQ